MAQPAVELAMVTRQYDAQTRVVLERTAKSIRARITRMGSSFSKDIRKAQLALVLNQIDKMLAGVWTGPMLDIAHAGGKAGAEAAEAAMETLMRPLYAGLPPDVADALTDGLGLAAGNNIDRAFARVPRRLSDTVYRNAGRDQAKVHELIQTGLASGLNAREMAKEVYQYVSPTTPGGASYAAMRLARTEINNAFHEQQREGAKRPGVKNAVWNLSGSHKVPDECNAYAKVREYPADAIPDKPHPQCFCYITYDTITPAEFEEQLAAGDFDAEIDRRTKENMARLGQPVGDTTPPAPQVPGNDRMRAAANSGIKGKPVELSGGVVAQTSKVTFKDGTVGVRKHVPDLDPDVIDAMRADGHDIDLIQTPKMMGDAEELSSMLARMMGLTAPEVVRVDSHTTLQEFKDGTVAAALPRVFDRDDKFKTFREYAESDQGKLIGLFDQIIGNDDRNDGNWLVDGKDLVVIDHGMAWNANAIFNGNDVPISGLDVFNAEYGRRWKDIDIHPTDLDAVEAMLRSMKDEFYKRGQEEWWAFSMGQIAAMRPHAKGDKRRIPWTTEPTVDRPKLTLVKNDDVDMRAVPTNDVLAQSIKTGIDSSEKLSGGKQAQTSKVEFNDGTSGVRKHIDPSRADAKRQQDAEELVPLLARMMGIHAPEVVRVDRETTIQQFLPGKLASSLIYDGPVNKYKARLSAAVKNDQGYLIALLDQLTYNMDRHAGNWLIGDDGQITIIDHGLAYKNMRGPTDLSKPAVFRTNDPFSSLITTGKIGDAQYKNNINIHPDDIDALVEILNSLKDRYRDAGQLDWWNFSMLQLENIRPHAKGKKRRIQ